MVSEKELNKINNWEQIRIVHCPNRECKGMLLSSEDCHELKCSDCGKYFISVHKYKQIIFNK